MKKYDIICKYLTIIFKKMYIFHLKLIKDIIKKKKKYQFHSLFGLKLIYL